MTIRALAFDTSNYTTSCAVFDGARGDHSGLPLAVGPGALGLRQPDALYAHIRQLPQVVGALELGGVRAVGASTRPREQEDSYMPCFLAGASQGAVLAKALDVPFFEFSHQQGHIAAAAWSAGRPELLDTPHLAWHLSGGTTELLYVTRSGPAVTCKKLGGTTDISAGQLIDRAGVLLGLPFPAGPAMDKLSAGAESPDFYEPRLDGLSFSLSGAEHKMKALYAAGAPPADVAYFTVMSVVSAVRRATARACAEQGGLPVLFSGGVAANTLLRREMDGGVFCEPQYAADNALGVAILTYRAVTADG